MLKIFSRRFHSSLGLKGYSQNIAVGLGIPIINKLCNRKDKRLYNQPLTTIIATEPCCIISKNPVLFLPAYNGNAHTIEEGVLFAAPVDIIQTDEVFGLGIEGPLTLKNMQYRIPFFNVYNHDKQMKQLLEFFDRKGINMKDSIFDFYPHDECFSEDELNKWFRNYKNRNETGTIRDFIGYYISGYV